MSQQEDDEDIEFLESENSDEKIFEIISESNRNRYMTVFTLDWPLPAYYDIYLDNLDRDEYNNRVDEFDPPIDDKFPFNEFKDDSDEIANRYLLKEILDRDDVMAGSTEDYRRMYEYILYLTSDGYLDKNVRVEYQDMKYYAVMQTDFLLDRFEELAKTAKARAEMYEMPKFSFEDFKKYKVSDTYRLYNYKNLRIFSMGIEKDINNNYASLNYSNMTPVQELRINPISLFKFISDDEIKELSLIYRILASTLIFATESFSKEIGDYKYALLHQKFINSLFYKCINSYQAECLNRSSYHHLSFNDELSSIMCNFYNKLYFKLNHRINRNFLDPDLSSLDSTLFLESQLSLFILLIANSVSFINAFEYLLYLYSPVNIPILDSFNPQLIKADLTKIFKSTTYDKVSNSTTDKDDCIICLSGYSDKSVIIQLDCGHMFHLECIEDWIKKYFKCPICKCKALLLKNLKRPSGTVNILN